VFGHSEIAGRPNVVLITIDTLRADHLSCYGYAWNTSPTIDRLADEGTRFERAYTVTPLTGPAHFSLFTSRYPHEHGARRNGVGMASDRALTALPQILRANSYSNAAFISAWPLTARLTRMDDWFDHYDEELTRRYQLFNSSRWAEDVTPRAIGWLKNNAANGKPVFLWVHYFDPHSPYEYREHFADLKQNGSVQPVRIGDEAMRERIRNYDTEIAYLDWHLEKLIGTIDALGLRQSTLVVLTADHGESLGEHGYVGHGRHLFEDIIRIPLIFRFPGRIKPGKVVPTPVSILDIAPTVLDMTVGNTHAEKQVPLTFAGRSLTPALTSEETLANRELYSVTFPGKKGFAPGWLSWLWVNEGSLPLRLGHLDDSRKLRWSPGERELVAFDLKADSDELQPRPIDKASQQYSAASERLRTWFEQTESRAREQELLKEDLEVLRSLGYIQ
jgi:arylsulfatase A-like enzyme